LNGIYNNIYIYNIINYEMLWIEEDSRADDKKRQKRNTKLSLFNKTKNIGNRKYRNLVGSKCVAAEYFS
jgi:hypothetical protein